jgi:hypothetical protein
VAAARPFPGAHLNQLHGCIAVRTHHQQLQPRRQRQRARADLGLGPGRDRGGQWRVLHQHQGRLRRLEVQRARRVGAHIVAQVQLPQRLVDHRVEQPQLEPHAEAVRACSRISRSSNSACP